jgi:UDP-N-acetylmuramoylalanine--D-glutamate ligase
MTLETLALQGNSIIHGSMAATIGTRVREIRKDLLKECFSDFQNTEHRLETIANIHGIEFVNDSKATNINASWFALETMWKPVIWITGGMDPGNDYKGLRMLVRQKVKAMICLSNDADKIRAAFADLEKPVATTQSMAEAVELAYLAGRKGDVVLFSPACPSFDLFKDYEERGRMFKLAVKNL